MKFLYAEILCLCLVLIICNAERTNRKPTLCRAAVLELKQYNSELSSGMEIINKNLEKYGVAAELAASNNVKIILYPEKGLFPMSLVDPIWFLKYAEDVPHGKENANPCKDEKFSNSPILRNLSCIAQKNKLMVVGALHDKKKCEVRESCENEINKNSCVTNRLDCPVKGFYYFNVLVVFNKKGKLVARYYKRHPFAVTDIDIAMPRYPEAVYFNDGSCSYSSDIGFDILFNDSLSDIQKRPRTSAVAYANWWFDHTPLNYFSVTLQQAWSLTNKITVLSSDVHAPNFASLGSGFYMEGKGAVVYSYNPDGRSKLLISNIPKSSSGAADLDETSLDTRFFYIDDDGTTSQLNGEEPRDFKEECGDNVLGINPIPSNDYRCHQTKVDNYTFRKLNKTEDNINICSNNFCCTLEYQAESMDETFYFAVSNNRLNFYELIYFGVQSCFLARCEPVLGKPCRNFLLKSNTKFLNLKMTGSFDTDHIYPHVLDSDLRLTDRDEWEFDGKSQLSYENMNGNNLVFVSLYGRNYEKDGKVNHLISPMDLNDKI